MTAETPGQTIVIGGGLAGLVAARELAREGRDVVIFEREKTVGGRVGTTHTDGFSFDHGFQVLFPAYPAVRCALDIDALNLKRFRPGAMLVRPGERSIIADPFRDPRAVTASVLNRSVTFRDKLRVLGLRRELAKTTPAEILTHDDQTIREFLEGRGFSTSFLQNFAAPFFGGITLDRSLESSRFVFEFPFKMLSEGYATVPADGMAAIPNQLATSARAAGVRIERSTLVRSLTPTAHGAPVETSSETVDARDVVVATDPAAASRLVDGVDIPTASRGCVTQYFSLPTRQQLDTDGRLLLNVASPRPNHVAVLSSVAPSYAPSGTRLLSATFLGTPEETDEVLAGEVSDALESWFPENRFDDLELLRTDRIERAQLTQHPGFLSQRPGVDAPEGQVYLAGDYTRWSSIQGALESGYLAAETVLDDE